jgi:hypothetical protein
VDALQIRMQRKAKSKKAAAADGRIVVPRKLVRTIGDAARFVDAVGFCTLFPVNKVPLPSLYAAVSGRDPGAGLAFDEHFENIWHWKDELPRRGRAFAGKLFRGRSTFISKELLPYFLAMRESASAASDHRHFYANGRIRDDARVIWEKLDELGPLATLELRHACGMETQAGNKRFKRAIVDLQCLLVVVHFGIERETRAWASGRYELTCRAFPEEVAAAAAISPEAARTVRAAKFLELRPGAPAAEVARLFGWTKELAEKAMLAMPEKTEKAEKAVEPPISRAARA